MEKSGQLRASVIKNGGNEAKGPVTGFSKKKRVGGDDPTGSLKDFSGKERRH